MYFHLYRVRFYSPTARKGHMLKITSMTMDSPDTYHARDYAINVYAQSEDLVKAHAKGVMSILGDDIEVTARYLASENGKNSDVYYLAIGTHKEA
jgi:hypothetical protein